MPWEVEYTNEFYEWWETLTSEQQERIDAVVRLLEERGPSLGRPYVDTIHNSNVPNLKELRVHQDGALRILFVFNPVRVAILLLGGNKSGQWSEWYKVAIPQAEGLYEEHLRELRKEGRWP